MTKTYLILVGILLAIMLAGGIAIGYGLFHRMPVEYQPDPMVKVLQAENAVLKDSITSLKSEVVVLDSSYKAKSNLYIITKRYYDDLKKKYGSANSDVSIDLLNVLFPE